MKATVIEGKWALVTGAASGMGRTTTLELAREKANLILVDVCGERLGNVAREAEALGASVHTFCVDLTDWDQVKGMSDVINTRWGAVDIIVNCAGIAHMAGLVETTLDDWQRLFAVNVWSIIHMVKAFAPGMIGRKSGHIVNISSGQAFFAVPTWGGYACTKYAVDGYSEALRWELSIHGIKVTTVYPGIVRTPFYDCIECGPIINIGLKILLATAVKPEHMSRMIVTGIKKKKKLVIQPIIWPIYIMKRIVPWPFELAGRAIAWALRKSG